jgi:hypothetical protein
VAIVKITQSNTIGICSPHPCPSSLGTLIVILVYNLSELHRQMLLKWEVWSLTVFTFWVTSLNPVSPNYLFSITNLITKNNTEVWDVVWKVWNSQNTTNFLETVMVTFPNNHKAAIKTSLKDFSKSMWVKMMDTWKKEGAAAPTFNVYAKGKLIKNNGL